MHVLAQGACLAAVGLIALLRA